MNRLVPDRIQSLPSRRADVVSPAGLEPASDSVSANEAIMSPAASAGRKASCWSREPNLAITWPAIPLLVPNSDRNAGVV